MPNGPAGERTHHALRITGAADATGNMVKEQMIKREQRVLNFKS